jgi:hypothetical protein
MQKQHAMKKSFDANIAHVRNPLPVVEAIKENQT